MDDVQNTILFFLLLVVGFGPLCWWFYKNERSLSAGEKKLVKDYEKDQTKSLGWPLVWVLGLYLLSVLVGEITGSWELEIAIFFLFGGILLIFLYQKKYRAFSKMGISENYLKTDRQIVYLIALFANLFGIIIFLVYMSK